MVSVAVSRARNWGRVRILLGEQKTRNQTSNIVYKEILWLWIKFTPWVESALRSDSPPCIEPERSEGSLLASTTREAPLGRGRRPRAPASVILVQRYGPIRHISAHNTDDTRGLVTNSFSAHVEFPDVWMIHTKFLDCREWKNSSLDEYYRVVDYVLPFVLPIRPRYPDSNRFSHSTHFIMWLAFVAVTNKDCHIS